MESAHQHLADRLPALAAQIPLQGISVDFDLMLKNPHVRLSPQNSLKSFFEVDIKMIGHSAVHDIADFEIGNATVRLQLDLGLSWNALTIQDMDLDFSLAAGDQRHVLEAIVNTSALALQKQYLTMSNNASIGVTPKGVGDINFGPNTATRALGFNTTAVTLSPDGTTTLHRPALADTITLTKLLKSQLKEWGSIPVLSLSGSQKCRSLLASLRAICQEAAASLTPRKITQATLPAAVPRYLTLLDPTLQADHSGWLQISTDILLLLPNATALPGKQIQRMTFVACKSLGMVLTCAPRLENEEVIVLVFVVP